MILKKFFQKSTIAITGLLAAVFIFSICTIFAHHAGATAVSGFQAGNFISDGVMTNYSSMNVADIQNFLNNQVSSCNTNQAGYTGSTGTVYNPPWICLKDFYENPSASYTVSFNYLDSNCNQQAGSRTYYHNNDYQYTSLTPVYQHDSNGNVICADGYSLKAVIQNMNGAIPSGAISAAQIIYNAAQQYQINPQVLLVLLQKEQSLVTDTSPAPWQYQSATGYGCPDFSSCTANNAGFSNQVAEAAYMFHAVETQNPNWYSPYIVGNNYILYNPDKSCGNSAVNIQNLATAALYDYTPYQPNQAALNAGWGTGDNCSSYGNRNFYLYFTSWFGSPVGAVYGAQYIQESPYPIIAQNNARTVSVEYRNIGSMPWYDQQGSSNGDPVVKIATSNPVNNGSPFMDPSWPNYNRPTALLAAVYNSDGSLSSNQHVVNPGQTGKYSFALHTWSNTPLGTQRQWFQLVAEGSANWNVIGSQGYFDVTVDNSQSQAIYTSQSAYPSINPGGTATAYFDFYNNGATFWKDSTTSFPGAPPVNLATSQPINRSSSFYSSSWSSTSRPTAILAAVYQDDDKTLTGDQHTVFPGQIGRYSFTISTPQTTAPGTYREWFQIISEGSQNWNIPGGMAFQDITVNSTPGIGFVSQSAYPTIAAGQSAPITFRFANTGNTVFNETSPSTTNANTQTVTFATYNPINRTSSFYSPSWSSVSRPATTFTQVFNDSGNTLSSDQTRVQPGQQFAYTITLSVPQGTSSGTYREWFMPIYEGSSNWSSGAPVYIDVTVP